MLSAEFCHGFAMLLSDQFVIDEQYHFTNHVRFKVAYFSNQIFLYTQLLIFNGTLPIAVIESSPITVQNISIECHFTQTSTQIRKLIVSSLHPMCCLCMTGIP